MEERGLGEEEKEDLLVVKALVGGENAPEQFEGGVGRLGRLDRV